jgi:hypothetical protein
VAGKFNAAQHPRDRFGRFTKSRTVKATPKDKAAAKAVAEGFKPKAVGQDRKAYLEQIAGGETSSSLGDLTDVNKALRAGKDSPEAEGIEQSMADLPDDVLLSRRVPLSAFGSTDPESLAGMKVRDAGFAPAQLGTVKAADGQVRMRIAAPAGTKAAVNPDTGEVILDRDTEMVVARVEKTDLGHDMYLTVLPKAGTKTPGNNTPEGGDTVRADLMKLKVPELRAQMRERGLKPGKLRKSQMVDALAADETGDSPAEVPALPFKDRLTAATSGEMALSSVPLSLTRQDTHARVGNRQGLAADSRTALLDYQGHSYSLINAELRGTLDPKSADVAYTREQIAAIDKAMTSSPLPQDVVTYRGVRNARRMFGDRLDHDLTGMSWREDAYLSTSTNQDVISPFASGNDGVRMRILTPAGVGALQLSETTDTAGHKDEAEILIASGRTLHVVTDHGVDSAGIRDLDVEVIPGG